jgi:hypothetical protein
MVTKKEKEQASDAPGVAREESLTPVGDATSQFFPTGLTPSFASSWLSFRRPGTQR